MTSYHGLSFESLIQMDSNQPILECISQNTPILPCHSMHHIVAYCHVMIVFRCVFRGRFCFQGYPWISDWRAVSYYHSIRQAKPSCSFRYNPTLSFLLSFTALGQQWFNCYMLDRCRIELGSWQHWHQSRTACRFSKPNWSMLSLEIL